VRLQRSKWRLLPRKDSCSRNPRAPPASGAVSLTDILQIQNAFLLAGNAKPFVPVFRAHAENTSHVRFGAQIAILSLAPQKAALCGEHCTGGFCKMPAKVLIVDDSQTTLLMEEMLLKQSTKFEVILAHDGQEAVEKALAELPSLILMDVIMPKLDGFAACREMRRHPKLREVPIILVTSRGEPENVEAGFESGCNDYLTKPIQSQELIQMVNGYLAAEQGR
jgi:CheY-like chemotaxis protein